MRWLRAWALVGVVAALVAGVFAGAWVASNDNFHPDAYPLELLVRPDPLVYVWELRPGESAQFFILLGNRWDEPLSPTIVMKPRWNDAHWLSVSPQSYSTTLQPGEERRVPFTLTASEKGAPSWGGEAKLRVDWSERGLDLTTKRDLNVASAGTRPLVDGQSLMLYGLVGAGLALATASVARGDWRALTGAAMAPLYSRIGRADALENERRRRIVAAIEALPGIHFAELSRRTRLPNGALYHHLGILEQSGLVTTRKERGLRRYSLATAAAPAGQTLTAAEERLLGLLAPEGVTATDLSERLGITRQGVYYHAKKLSERGLLRAEIVEGGMRYYPV